MRSFLATHEGIVLFLAVAVCITHHAPFCVVRGESPEYFQRKIQQNLVAADYAAAVATSDEYLDEHTADCMAFSYKGIALYALGKMDAALSHWRKSLQINPDFEQPRVEIAKHFLKTGRYAAGFAELNSSIKNSPEVEALRGKLAAAERLMADAQSLYAKKMWERCSEVLDKLSSLSSYSVKMREMLVDCFIKRNMFMPAIRELKNLYALETPKSDRIYKLSKLFLAMGDTVQGFAEVKECLNLDPDNPKCLKLFKAMNKLNKSFKDAEQTIATSNADGIRKFEQLFAETSAENPLAPFQDAEIPGIFQGYSTKIKVGLCTGYLKSTQPKAPQEALKWCQAVVKENDKEYQHLLNLANAYILAEEYESAIKQFNRILELFPNDPSAEEGLRKAQNLQRQASRRDYYKILDVPKNASDKEIKRAYRKKALEYHPDKHPDPEFAQKKMSDVNAAYEVLKDPKTRRNYDNGIDPNDPQASAGGGGFQNFNFNGGSGHGGGYAFNMDDFFQMFNEGGGGAGGGGHRQQRGGGGFHFGGGAGGGRAHQQHYQQQRHNSNSKERSKRNRNGDYDEYYDL